MERFEIPTIPDEYFVAALRLIGMASLEGAYHASEFRKVGEVYDLLNTLLQLYQQEEQGSALIGEGSHSPAQLTMDHLFIIEVAVAFALERGKLEEQSVLARAVHAGFKEHNDALRKQAEQSVAQTDKDHHNEVG